MPGARVQGIDILRDERRDAPLGFEFHECAMRAIRLCTCDRRPADEAAQPVTRTHCRIADESLVGDRRTAFPEPVCTSVVRNAGCSADAGAGQDEDAIVCGQPFAQRSGGPGLGIDKRYYGNHHRMLAACLEGAA